MFTEIENRAESKQRLKQKQQNETLKTKRDKQMSTSWSQTELKSYLSIYQYNYAGWKYITEMTCGCVSHYRASRSGRNSNSSAGSTGQVQQNYSDTPTRRQYAGSVRSLPINCFSGGIISKLNRPRLKKPGSSLLRRFNGENNLHRFSQKSNTTFRVHWGATVRGRSICDPVIAGKWWQTRAWLYLYWSTRLHLVTRPS